LRTRLYLTILAALAKRKNYKSAVIVTTACEHKNYDKYALLTKTQLLDFGFSRVDMCDQETDSMVEEKFIDCDVIYVCGGNTFTLLNYANSTKFYKSVNSVLQRDGLYLGVSAGSIIATPTIDVAREIHPDENLSNYTVTKALNLVPFHVLPHYKLSDEPDALAFEKRHQVVLKRIANGQARLSFR
jgi:dipeptidase E